MRTCIILATAPCELLLSFSLSSQPVTALSSPHRMPKNKKKCKKEDENFDDMLAEFQVGDLAAASSAGSPLAKASLSSTARMEPRPSTAPLHSSAPANGAGRNVSEDAIINAFMSENMAQLRRWGRQGIRVTTAEPLCQAVLAGATFALLSCLVRELGADVNGRDKNGYTALTAAAGLGQHENVRYLIVELGADVNRRDNFGLTPLYVAVLEGRIAGVQVLINLGADLNIADNDGATPLMMATFKKHQEIVKWLVKAGADTQIAADDMSAADVSRRVGASAEQTAYLDAKTHCSNVGCSGAGIMKCTGCKQARYCGEACQLAHWKAHKVDCRRWSVELQLAAAKCH
jgi:hypothetical protein